MVTIKKYSNRRLYDTSTSSYITLEELAAKIRDGTDVRVVHAQTDEDITQQVLAQIILESRGAARLLPVPLLMRLIRMGEDRLAEFFGQFMSWSLEIYLRFKEGAETMTPYNPFGGNAGGAEPFWRMFMGQAPWSEDGSPWSEGPVESEQMQPSDQPAANEADGEDESAEAAGARDDEVGELRREVAELKESLGEMRAEVDGDDSG